jgi:SAM-dependent methyltransferase
MRWIRLDPPGEICQIEAVVELLQPFAPRTFVDVGCGGGSLSRELCRRGLRGVGVEPSSAAAAVAAEALASPIGDGAYRLVQKSLDEAAPELSPVDAVVCMMVLEHLHDDAGFLDRLASLARPGGVVVVAVQARMDRWGFEDEVVGHLRRYERRTLQRLLEGTGLGQVKVWSVAVPVANLLQGLGNRLVRRATSAQVAQLGPDEQTATSGIREVPWKTVFPRAFRWVLNRRCLYPLLVLQRLFYGTSLGLIMVGAGVRPPATLGAPPPIPASPARS